MHKSIIHACLVGAVAVTGVAHAELQSKEFQIKLHADVPVVGGFDVKPVGWSLSDEQVIVWDAEGKKFTPLTLTVNLKSGVGGVHVKFANADVQKLSHATQEDAYYALSAKVGDKDVGTDKVSVLTKDEAKDGKDVALVITPDNASEKIANAPLEGKYTGTLQLVFESNVD
ncbi:CS1 type fimbrial major subunit [Burkholderia latens]|uniref:CS1 type fimbrial major subunit n=1 Tax=Burkholderia latens TaxID=488446 RepID=UPI00158ACA57|nr:CS1 type fimbrial major subunit [Burkholderia latens]